MSTPQAPPSIDPAAAAAAARTRQGVNLATLAGLVLGTVVLALPPRRLGATNLALGGGVLFCGREQYHLRTNRGRWAPQQPPAPMSERESAAEQRRMERRNPLEKVWMGGERDGWKQRRLEEEREALARGEGYGDLISKHIADGFGVGGKVDGEDSK